MTRLQQAAMVVAFVAGLTGCSSGPDKDTTDGGQAEDGARTGVAVGSETGGGGDGTPSEDAIALRVGTIPITHAAPLLLGIQEGFFADEGLEVDVEFAAGGAAILPAVVAGEFDVGYGNTTSIIQANSAGLDIRVIADNDHAHPSSDGAPTQIMVRADSGIESAADLEGKTIAVNTLNALNHITAMASAEALGADPAALEFVEMGFPDMLPALEAGRVDAVNITEPFTTLGLASGKNVELFGSIAAARPGLLNAAYFVTQDYIDENADVVDRFRRAIVRATKFAHNNHDAVRTLLPTYTQISPEIASSMRLPGWSETAEVDIASIEYMADLMVKYGFIDEKPDMSRVVHLP